MIINDVLPLLYGSLAFRLYVQEFVKYIAQNIKLRSLCCN